MKKSRAYQPDLIESLRDSEEAEEYGASGFPVGRVNG